MRFLLIASIVGAAFLLLLMSPDSIVSVGEHRAERADLEGDAVEPADVPRDRSPIPRDIAEVEVPIGGDGPGSPSTSDIASVSGRILDGHTGNPVPRCEVSGGALREELIPLGQTDASGFFEVHVDLAETVFKFSASGYVSTRFMLHPKMSRTDGRSFDYGVLKLFRGATVRFFVVDESGAPSRERITVEHAEPEGVADRPFTGGHTDVVWIRPNSSPHHSLELRLGTWYLSTSSPRYRVADQSAVLSVTGDRDFHVVLTERRVLSGALRDEWGLPVTVSRGEAIAVGRDGRLLSSPCSIEKGGFHLELLSMEDSTSPFSVRIDGCDLRVREGQEFQWNESSINLVVEDPNRLLVRAVDQSGKVVPSMISATENPEKRRFVGRPADDEGRYHLSSPKNGLLYLQARPSEDGFGPSEVVRFAVGSSREVELVVPAEKEVLVAVRDPVGQPIEGAEVVFFMGQHIEGQHVIAPYGDWGFVGPLPAGSLEIVAQGKTGPDGTVRLFVTERAGRLRIGKGGYMPLDRAVHGVADRMEEVLPSTDAADLSVRIEPDSMLRVRSKVRLVSVDRPGCVWPASGLALRVKRSPFVFRDVPIGRWRVEFFSSIEIDPCADVVAEAEMEGGSVALVRPGFAPGGLRVSMKNGETSASACRLGSDGVLLQTAFHRRPAKNGVVSYPALLPGRYRVFVFGRSGQTRTVGTEIRAGVETTVQ